MNKKGTRALASATVVGLVLATVATGNVKAAPGDVNKVQGNDRYETAANVAKANWKDGAKDVIIASGNGYADSLSASVLAKKLNAPIILTTAGELNSNAKSALQTLKPENVYVIGGNASVSQAVRDGLKKDYKVTELGGKTRFETNLAVANHLVDKLGVKADNVMVVNGQDGFSDALSAAPVAAAKEQVLLIVGRDASTADLAANFVKKHNSKVTVIGTEGVVPTAVYNKLGASERVNGGADRFDTNLKIMEHFKLNADNIYVANATDGQNGYADALVASALAGKSGAPLVLVDTKDAQGTKNAIKYIADNKTDKTEVSTVGGSGVMPDEIVNEIETAVNPELSAAEKAVKAYEDAKIGTAQEITAAKALKADAVKAVNNVKDATKKSAFEARIAAKDKAIAEAEADQGIKIQSISAISLNQVKVVFNKDLQKESAQNINNYKLNGDALTATDAKATLLDDERTVIITFVNGTKNQGTSKKFEVKDSVIKEKNTGYPVPGMEGTVTFEDIKAPAVEKVTMKGAKTLKIMFSEGINYDELNESSNFKIDGQSIGSLGGSIKTLSDPVEAKDATGLKVKFVNEISIEFDSTLEAGNHTLTVAAQGSRDITDSSKFVLAKSDISFSVQNYANEPKIISATGKVDGEVTLVFDREMDEDSIANNAQAFEYNGAPAVSAILDQDDDSDRTVKIQLSDRKLDEGKQILKIKKGNIKDAYGNYFAQNDDLRLDFTVEKDKEAPKLESVYAVDENTVRLVFNESLEDNEALLNNRKDNGDIKIYDVNGEVQFGDSKNPFSKVQFAKNNDGSNDRKKVDLVVNDPSKLGKAEYTVKVKGLSDAAGNIMDSASKKFTTIDNTDPTLLNGHNLVLNLDKDDKVIKETAKVIFNEPMDKSSIGDVKNYLYNKDGKEYKSLPDGSSISVASDGRSATITFPKDTVDKGWINTAKIKVMNVKDAAGNRIKDGIQETEAAVNASEVTNTNNPKITDTDVFDVEANDYKVWITVGVTGDIDDVSKDDFKLKIENGKAQFTPNGDIKPESVVRVGSKKLKITFAESTEGVGEDGIRKLKALGDEIHFNNGYKALGTKDAEGAMLIADDDFDVNDKVAPILAENNKVSDVNGKKDIHAVELLNPTDAKYKTSIKINFVEDMKNMADAYKDDFDIVVKGKLISSDDIDVNVKDSSITLNTKSGEAISSKDDISIKFKSKVDLADKAGNLFVPGNDEITGKLDIDDSQVTVAVTEAKKILTPAIKEANENKTATEVSVDGTDVLKSKKWVAQEDMNTYTTAIENAKKVEDKADATKAEVEKAVKELGTATKTFNDAKKDGIKVVADVKIATEAIDGVTAPVKGATPVATITDTDEYTATIKWVGALEDGKFKGDTVYTAEITITPKTGYTLTGVIKDFFKVAGATATNDADKGVVTAEFPATGA
ncbi:cell wall-binding repeat-containing protein [Clostridium botulinum]|uniref:cell wall-binding repeat-containing protein n=1 Tax=Clostridium botulinum TaxID=1491 RepID=UPI003DA5D7C6